MKDVEMKGDDKKPEEDKKEEEVAKVEEPQDQYFGKLLRHPWAKLTVNCLHRTEEVPGAAGESREGEGL